MTGWQAKLSNDAHKAASYSYDRIYKGQVGNQASEKPGSHHHLRDFANIYADTSIDEDAMIEKVRALFDIAGAEKEVSLAENAYKEGDLDYPHLLDDVITDHAVEKVIKEEEAIDAAEIEHPVGKFIEEDIQYKYDIARQRAFNEDYESEDPELVEPLREYNRSMLEEGPKPDEIYDPVIR